MLDKWFDISYGKSDQLNCLEPGAVFTQLSFSTGFTFSILQSLHMRPRTFTHTEAHDPSGHNT